MSDIKRLSLMSVAVCAIASSAYAQGDNFYSRDKYVAVLDRNQPEFDPEPVRLGTFLVRSEAEIGLTYSDNVFATSNNTESGLVGVAGVRASGDTNWSVHGLGFDVAAFRNEYFDQDSESNNDLLARLRGRLDVTRQFQLGGGVFVENRAEPRTDFVNGFGADAPIEYTRHGVYADASYTNDRFRWYNRVAYTDADYENGRQIGTGLPIDQSYRDSSTLEGFSRVSYALSPDLAVFTQASYTQRDYDTTQILGGVPRSRDSKGYTVAAGVDFELQTLIRGDIAVGYLNETKDDSFFSDVSGLSIDGRLQWFPTQLTTVGFEAGRQVVDVGAIDSPSATMTRLGARVDHELRRNVIVSGFVRSFNYEYEDTDREDDNLEIGGIATYKMNKRVHWEAFVTRRDRDVSGTGLFGDPSFEENRFGLRLSLFP